MIRHAIVQYGHWGLLFLVLLFIWVKGIYIRKSGKSKHFTEMFLGTLVPMSRQSIKNTFEEKTKRYYKRSNTLNYIFYCVFALAIGIYIMMHSIS